MLVGSDSMAIFKVRSFAGLLSEELACDAEPGALAGAQPKATTSGRAQSAFRFDLVMRFEGVEVILSEFLGVNQSFQLFTESRIVSAICL